MVTPIAEIVDEINDAGGDAFKYCFQCGKCDVVCPWNRVRPFSIRKIVWQASLGLPEIELDEIWRCTTCGMCPAACPRGVEQIEVGVAIRRIAAAYDVYPASVAGLSAAGSSLAGDGNPLNEKRETRNAWAEGLSLKPFTEGMEILFFVGCYYSYDSRLQKAAIATASLLKKAGVDFGILGSQESCCGESIRKAGNEEVFKTLAKENIKAFIDNGVKRVLVASPHCYHTFKNEYPEFMVNFEVVHISQFLQELIEQHNGIYDQPRDVLTQLDGLDLVEMPDTRDKSLCCGGGGGRIWAETPKGERFSDIRVAQAVEVGAEVLATACPYCISNFEESALSLEDGTTLEIKDLTEVLFEALQNSEGPA
jgi:Fe-S oxidoreductase